MKDFDELKLAIAEVIRNNGNNEITGNILQEMLLEMVDSMELSEFEGFAVPDTEPVTDKAVSHYYIAVQQGLYTHFDSFVLTQGDIVVFAKLAGETTWTKVNLSASIKSLISAIYNAKQDNLSAGDGIAINDNVVIINNGAGVTFDSDGKLAIDDDFVKDLAETYIDQEKGQENGIMGLNASGVADKDNLPDDISYFEESEVVDYELIHAYEQTLARAYQMIDAVEVLRRMVETNISDLNTAKEEVRLAISQSEQATNYARSEGDRVAGAIQRLNDAIARANTATAQAESRIQEITQVISIAQSAASDASANAIAASNAATLANTKALLADTAANLADAKATYADEQGDYAKEQGENAEQIMDSAKGDYDTLDERLDAMESADIVVVDNTNPIDE